MILSFQSYWKGILSWWATSILLPVISKLDIFPLIFGADKVWITELNLTHKNIRSVQNSYTQELTLILKMIWSTKILGQFKTCIHKNWLLILKIIWSTKILGQFKTRIHKNWLWYWKLSVSETSNTFWSHW
jgi:hypothetical protein